MECKHEWLYAPIGDYDEDVNRRICFICKLRQKKDGIDD